MQKEKINFITIAKLPITSLRKLYNWTINWSRSKNAPYALFIISFAESSFFPIPPDVLLIAMTVANIKRWFANAIICLSGSLLGAIFGYLIGWGLYESIGQPIVDFYHAQATMDMIGTKFAENAFLFIFIAAFTPVPYKIVTISAGLFGLSLPVLLLSSLLGRGGRFLLVSGALRLLGKRFADTIEKYFDWFSIAFVLLLVGGFLAVKYLF